jgi:predicted NBD/HSP70 family sugar kinase
MQPPYGQGYPQQPPYGQPPPQKKGTNPIIIVLAIVGGVIVVGFAGCLVCVGAGAGVAAHEAEKEKAEKKAAKDDLVKVSAEDLIAAYDKNEVKADNKYKGKWVEVSGIVANVAKDLTDDAYIVVGTGKEFEVIEVQCTFSDKKKAKAAADLDKGEKVKVRGFVKGKLMNVQLEDCELP